MALVTADRVRETTTVVGTGAATLLGAVTGYQSFSVVGNGNTCYYCIADQSGSNWEVGLGTYSTTGPTLTRTTVLSSSNGGAAVNFSAGTKDVFITYPAELFPAIEVQAGTGTQTSGTLSFSNANGVSFGMNAGTITASYTVPSVPAQTQQPMYFSASGTSTSANTLQFGNSNGVSFSLSNGSVVGSVKTDYLTTAMASNASTAFAGTGFTSTTTAGTAIVGTHNTAGLSLGVPAYLTTYAAQSVQPVAYSAANGSANFSTLTFANSNGVSFSTGTQGVYATVKTDYLTTAMASNASTAFAGTGFTSTTTAGTAIVGTHNTAGLSLGVPAYLTTYTPGGGPSVVASGNTSGAMATVSSGTLTLAGGNNITLSQNGNAITISAANAGGAQTGISGVVVSDATYTSGTITFQNANGISFGSSGANGISASYTVPTQTVQPVAYSAANGSANFSTITFANSNGVSFSTGTQGLYATVKTDYLTTAMASNASTAFAGTGFTSTTTNGSVVAGTQDTAGLKLAVPPYITTYVAQTVQPVAYSAANGSANFSTITFANSNGVSFSTGTQGLYATVKTDYLTTAMASNASTAFAGTGFTTTTAAGSVIAGTQDTAGLKLAVPPYITTYVAQTVQPVAYSAANGSANFSTLTFANSNGVSFSSGTQGLYATVATNYLTTARASNDAIGLNTAGTNVTWTVNSSGLSFNGSGYAGTGTTFAGTNVSATVALNSNGLNLALSGGAGGAGDGYNIVSASGNTTGTLASYSTGTMVLAGGQNLTLSQSSNTISFNAPQSSSLVAGANITLSTNGSTISIIGGAGAGGGIAAAAGTQTATSGTIVFADSNGISFGMSNSSQITMSVTKFSIADAGDTASDYLQVVNSNNITFDIYNSGSPPFNKRMTASYAFNASAGTQSSALNGLTFANSNGMTFGLSAGTITASAAGNVTQSFWMPYPSGNNSSFLVMGQNTVYMQALVPPAPVAVSNVELMALWSYATSTNSCQAAMTIRYGLYEYGTGGSTESIQSIATSSMSIQASYNSSTTGGLTIGNSVTSYTANTNGGSAMFASVTGPNYLYLPFTTTLQDGKEYFWAMHFSSATTGNTGPLRLNMYMQTIMNSTNWGELKFSTIGGSKTNNWEEYGGMQYSATSGGLPSAVNSTQFQHIASQARMFLIFENE